LTERPSGNEGTSVMSGKKKRVERCVMTFARAWNTLAATRCLGRHGIEVITGDSMPLAGSNFSFYSRKSFIYPDPDENPEGFIDKLVEVCERYGGPDVDLVLMPLHTCSFVVAEHIHRFDGIAKTALPAKKDIDMLGNKANLAVFCAERGINIPKTFVVDTVDDIRDTAEKVAYPAFLKLADSNAAIGLHKVKSPKETVERFMNDVRRFNVSGRNVAILQEAVPGEDYCSTFLFERGELRTSMTYHNILEYPKKSGMGALRETVDASKMEEIGARVLAAADWHGVAELDFRWDGKNEPYLIEVNPRFWGGLGQSIESGVEYPHLLFRLAVDGHVDPVTTGAKNVRTVNPCLVVMLMLQEFMEAKNTRSEIKRSFEEFMEDWQREDDHFKALDRFSDNMASALNPFSRVKAVDEVLRQTRGAVDELFNKKDPLPALGLLYPLAAFIKKRKISPEALVTGAAKSQPSETN